MKLRFVNKAVPLAVFLFVAFSCFISLLTIFYGTESYSMLHIFSHDESDQVARLQRLLENNTLDTGGFKGGFYSYGQFYPTVAFWVMKSISLFGFESVNYQFTALTLKIISILAYFFSVYFIYRVIRLMGGIESISAAFAFIFAVIPNYWDWASAIHPDTLQMLTLILPMYALLKINNKYLSIIVASFIVGISFGTKYAGFFAVILIAAYVFLVILQRHLEYRKSNNIRAFFLLSSWSVISFLLGWLLFNPYVLTHFNKFFSEMISQSNSIKFGYGNLINNNGFEWFTIFYDQLGILNSFFLLFGVITGIAFIAIKIIETIKSKEYSKFFDDKLFSIVTAVSIYVIFSSLYLILVVKYREVRYGFHVLPYLIFLSFYGFNCLISRIKINNIFVLIMSISIIIFSYSSYSSNLSNLSSRYSEKLNNPYLDAGEWMVNNYSSETAILAGTYSYVPNDFFKRYSMTYDLNNQSVLHFDPDVIVMNNSVPGRYVWKKPGTLFKSLDIDESSWSYWDDKEMLDEYLRFYSNLVSVDSNWIIVYESDSVVIFEKK